MPLDRAMPNSARTVGARSARVGCAALTFRVLSSTPGTASAAMEWSPLHLSVLSAKTSSESLPRTESQDDAIVARVADHQIGGERPRRSGVHRVGQVHALHGRPPRPGIRDRAQLVGQLPHQPLRFPARRDDAVALAPLEVEVEAVESQPVGPGRAPVHRAERPRLRGSRAPAEAEVALLAEPAVEVERPVEGREAVVGHDEEGRPIVHPLQGLPHEDVHVAVRALDDPGVGRAGVVQGVGRGPWCARTCGRAGPRGPCRGTGSHSGSGSARGRRCARARRRRGWPAPGTRRRRTRRWTAPWCRGPCPGCRRGRSRRTGRGRSGPAWRWAGPGSRGRCSPGSRRASGADGVSFR